MMFTKFHARMISFLNCDFLSEGVFPFPIVAFVPLGRFAESTGPSTESHQCLLREERGTRLAQALRSRRS